MLSTGGALRTRKKSGIWWDPGEKRNDCGDMETRKQSLLQCELPFKAESTKSMLEHYFTAKKLIDFSFYQPSEQKIQCLMLPARLREGRKESSSSWYLKFRTYFCVWLGIFRWNISWRKSREKKNREREINSPIPSNLIRSTFRLGKESFTHLPKGWSDIRLTFLWERSQQFISLWAAKKIEKSRT